MRKLKLYNKAIKLRKRGFSYSEILKIVPVSNGTISRWCSNVPLSEKQEKRLWRRKVRNPFILKLEKDAVKRKKAGQKWARKMVKMIPCDEKSLFIIGIMLYWAEGARFSSSPTIQFTNTDSKMIKIMMKFFRIIMEVSEEKFRITVRIREGGIIRKAENYWQRITKVSKKKFNKVCA